MTGFAFGLLMQTTLLSAGPQTYDQAYKQAEANGQPIVVLVGADWCPGCRTMKTAVMPRLQQSGKLKGANYAVVNTDAHSELADRLMRGSSIPQLIVFAKTDKGWHREQITGATSEAAVEQLLNRAVAAQIAAKVARPKVEVASGGGQ